MESAKNQPCECPPCWTKEKYVDTTFTENIKKMQHNMFRLARSIVRNDADAEDAVGEAIVKAYDKRQQLRNMECFQSWMMRIVVNESYKIAKQRSRIEYIDDVSSILGNEKEENRELWAAVHQLPAPYRATVVLFYYEDMSIEQIAQVLYLPKGTVKSRLARGRQKLKEILSHEEEEQ